jgi:hypothetical protein
MALGSAAVLTLAACSSPAEEPPGEKTGAEQSAPEQEAEIATDTPAGERSQWIVDVLNADEDTTVEEWEPLLHEDFVAEVPADELVDLINTNLRPAKPFAVSAYQGTDTQAVTTLENPLTDPMDVQLAIDEEGQIIGLFFGPSAGDT